MQQQIGFNKRQTSIGLVVVVDEWNRLGSPVVSVNIVGTLKSVSKFMECEDKW